MKKIFKNIDLKLFLILLFSVSTPFIFKTFRASLVYKLSYDEYTISQAWGYLYLIFETINMFVLIPSYSFIKNNVKNNNDIKQKSIIAFLFSLIFFLFSVFLISILGISISNKFISLNENSNYNFLFIYRYIFLLGLGISLHLIINVFTAYLILNKGKIEILIIVLTSLFSILFFDFIFLFQPINPNANIISISYSSITSSLFIIFFTFFFIYLRERKEWNKAFKTFGFKKWKKDYKIFFSTGLWLALEGLIWNVAWVTGVTLFLQDGLTSNAFWTMDSIFWGCLLIPSNAINFFTAQNIANKKTYEEKQEQIKNSFYLSFFVFFIWIILIPIIIFLILPNIFKSDDPIQDLELLTTTRSICYIMIPFFGLWVFYRIIYTYFSTTGQSFKILFSTILSILLTWIPTTIIYLTGVEINSIYLIVFIYGFGLFVITLFSFGFWLMERMSWYKPKEEGLWAKLTNYSENKYILNSN